MNITMLYVLGGVIGVVAGVAGALWFHYIRASGAGLAALWW